MQAGTERRRSTIDIKALTKMTLERRNTQAIQQKLAPLSNVLEKNQIYISNAYKQGQPVFQTCKKCSPALQQQRRPEAVVSTHFKLDLLRRDSWMTKWTWYLLKHGRPFTVYNCKIILWNFKIVSKIAAICPVWCHVSDCFAEGAAILSWHCAKIVI